MFVFCRSATGVACSLVRKITSFAASYLCAAALIAIFSAGLARIDGHWRALAHTNTVGYVVSTGNAITVYYGTYHGTNNPEGIISIIGPVTMAQPAGNITSTKPVELIDNINNFRATSCGGLNPNRTVMRWQSATFTGVPSGTYSITLTGSFSQNWQPCSSEMSSPTSTFTFDTNLPVISGMPADIVQGTDAGQPTAVVTWTPPTATDDVAIASFTSTHNPGDTFPIGTTTVTYTAQDTSGGITTGSFTVTINDTEDPVVSPPANQTVEATSSNGATATFAFVANDNVGVANTTSSPVSGSQFPLGTTTVMLSANDAAGNTGTGSFDITVVDTTAPNIVTVNVNTTTDPGASTAVVSYNATVNDSVGVAATTYSPPSGSAFPVGVTTVTASASDAAANTSTETFTVTVLDDEVPVVTVPSNITVDTDTGSATAVVTYSASAIDNVDGAIVPILNSGPSSGASFPIGVTTVSYRATDSAGNTGTASFTVTVADTEDPTSTSIPSNITQSADPGSSTAVVTYVTPTFSDNSGNVTVMRTGGLASGEPFPVGATTITYEATDASGNTEIVSFTVTVTDNEPPVVTVPANIMIGTDPSNDSAVVTYIVSASDNTDGSLSPSLISGLVSGAAFPIGSTTVAYSARDLAGNAATGSFTVTVIDDEAPVVTVPGNITITTDPGSASATVNYTIAANDNVDGALTPALTSGLTSGAHFPLGTTTVTYQAIDAAGNTGEATFTVTVQDGEAPIVSVPANISVNTDPGSASAVVTYAVSGFDNTDGILTPIRTAGLASGAAFPIGTTIMTYEATDLAGNTTSESFTVTVSDAERPVITSPANITVTTDSGTNTAVVTYPISATDNVDGSITPTLTAGLASGTAFPVGITTVTYQAIDSAGNTSTVTFTVTVTDNEAPTVVSVPNSITQDTDPGSDTSVVTYATPVFADNVGITSVARSNGLDSGAAFPVGTTTVTHIATDADGNSVEAIFTVTVVDVEAPTIVPPANISVSTDPGSSEAVVTFPLTATDNYGVATLTSSPTTGSSFPLGATVVTITATDTFGNTSTSTFTVTVTDNENPTLAGVPEDILVTVDYPTTSAPVSFATPTINDNAQGATVSQTSGLASGSSFPLGTTVVMYEGRDASSNIVTASFNVTVRQTPPGDVTFVVNADVNDGTFRFASPEPNFNFSISTSNGVGQSANIPVRPGSYNVVATAPSGFGFISIHCSDDDSVSSISTASVIINLQTSESVTCTFETADSRTRTSEAIGNFLRRRNDLLLSSEHDWDRQIDRLARRKSKPAASGLDNSTSSFGGNGFGGRLGEDHGAELLTGSGFGRKLPGALSVSVDTGISTSFATSMSELQNFSATSEQRRVLGLLGEDAYKALGAEELTSSRTSSNFDIWTEGRYTRYDDDNPAGAASGHFALLYLGADYIVNPSLLVGIMGQYDDTREESDADDLTIHGRGWMVGPYATIKLAPSLYFQGRAAWGQSRNEISPFNTYSDTFDTERWLVRGRLQGRWNYGDWLFSPSASFAYIEERQYAYTDSLNVLIPEQKATLGQAEFGPEASYTINLEDGSQLIPTASFKGVWNFAEENSTRLSENAGGDNNIRAKAGAGLKFIGKNGVSFELSGTYDGIFDEEYESLSGNFRLHIPLN